jgi:hypothetical protein
VAETSFDATHARAQAHDAALPNEIYSINRLTAGWRLPELPKGAQWASPPEGRDEAQIEFSWAGETARHIGTVVHRWLQRIAQDELKGWDAKRVDALTAGVRRELQRRGLRALDSKTAGELVRLALNKTIIDERGRWLLGPHAEARSELRLRVAAGKGVRTYVVDRFFRAADGQKWVIDYKTSRHEGANVDAFLDRERDRYTVQLKSYAQAIPQSRQGLYFPLLGGWREYTEK